MRCSILAALALVTISLAPHGSHARKYKSSGLYNVDQDIGLQDIDGTVAAFGDFNGDKFTDIITLGSDQQSFGVYLWDHTTWAFRQLKEATVRIEQTPRSFIITNIVPGDFNHDGRLDVLVMGQENPPGRPDSELQMRVYLGNSDNGWETQYITVPSSTAQQPMTFDLNGDMRTDLLGYAYDGYQPANPQLSVWKNVYSVNNRERIFEVQPMQFAGEAAPKCILGDPHSSAFVDLDGDCLADPATGAQSWVIYVNDKEKGYTFSQSGSLPAGAGQVSFADMDGDGAVDMVIPACTRDGCSIYINYNQQMPLCTSKDQKDCRSVLSLCVKDPMFSFTPVPDHVTETGGFVRFSLNDVLPRGQRLLLTDTAFRGKLPVSVHVGDFNLDSYPDLLIVSAENDGRGNALSQATLLQSVLCTPETCRQDEVTARRRTFVKVVEGADVLNSVQDVRAAAFLDLDEDGTVDIMLLRRRDQGQAAARAVSMIHNNYFNDAFFLKTLASNGVCPNWCGLSERPERPGARPFGVNYPGATFKFTILDTSGRKRANQVAQYPSSTYAGLLTPYSLFGLGRTNNYVEELFVGVTRHQTEHFTTYSGVIPNSQLIIIPYQSEDRERVDRGNGTGEEGGEAGGGGDGTGEGETGGPSEWTLELYIRPGDYVPWVFVTVVTAIALLAGVVVSLNWMEKREDERERKKALHIINFDAL
ncbi:hypothetical protein DFQ27_007823 [Actinomortierella ambigua]|uniref:T-cell immunomodulatory protein TIP C2 domain-containing protein n=1 Tax=Actinomortierella ambigua TaxID=1343610 RepID=A0A9P6PSS7_9FUNG|nr:hypothetical protein DFQ27_007823 [Actinomortierella ambigua]